jgi:hypothetical protein
MKVNASKPLQWGPKDTDPLVDMQLPAYFRQDAEGHLVREDRPLMAILELLENARKHMATSYARLDEACEKMKIMEQQSRKDQP